MQNTQVFHKIVIEAAKRVEEEIRRKEQVKEKQIEIQKEAYLRVMDVLRSEKRGA